MMANLLELSMVQTAHCAMHTQRFAVISLQQYSVQLFNRCTVTHPTCSVPKPTTQKGTAGTRTFHPSDCLLDYDSVSYHPDRVQFSKSRENPFQENKHSRTTGPFCYLFELHNSDQVKTFIWTHQKELVARDKPNGLFLHSPES